MACDVISHLVIQQVLIVNEAKYSGVGTQHLCVCYIYRRNHVLLLLAIDEGDANYRFQLCKPFVEYHLVNFLPAFNSYGEMCVAGR